jgi:transposase
MFLKPILIPKGGKELVYWQLVESYRTARGPRHRVVAYLGELEAGDRAGYARLAAQLDNKAASKVRQLTLWEDAPNQTVPARVEIDLSGVRVACSREFGEVFLGLALWRTLSLDEFFERELPGGREAVPWGLMACVVTLARLIEPSSELHIADTWYRRTALPQLLGVATEEVNEARLYRTLDAIWPFKTKLEVHLKERLGELFALDLGVLLYDVTSTYFEGLAEGNPQAQYGYSRDHRPDCKQVLLALVVTREGFPLGFEVFEGNRHDTQTLKEIVEAMEAKYGKIQRVWVFDRGVVNEENLALIRERGGQYLVGTPKALLRQFEKHLVEKDWAEVEAGVEVKLVPSAAGTETFVLCRSAARRAKEEAMHERFLKRIEEALQRMQRGLQRDQQTRRREALERQIGRLLERNPRAAKAFRIELQEDPLAPGAVKIVWERVKAWQAWADLSEGCYLLRTNLTGQSPQELWRTYIQLTDVEEVFRAEKSPLQIRPIWHQKEGRVKAHILFSFLAYALWKTLQTWMERAGLGRGVRTVLEEFGKLKVQ